MGSDLNRGMFTSFGFAQESTYGTLAAAAHWLRVLGVTPSNNKKSAVDPVLSEHMDEEVYYFQDQGSLDVALRENYEGHELLWHALLGTYNYTLAASGEGQHELKYDPDDTHDFVTGLSCHWPMGATTSASQRALSGAHVTRAVIEGDPEDFLRTTFSLLGQKLQKTTNASPSYPSRLPVLGARATSFTLGHANVKCNNWRISIEVPRIGDRAHYGNQSVSEPVRVDKLRGTIEAQIEFNTGTTAGAHLLDELHTAGVTATPTRQSFDVQHTTIGNISGGANPYEMNINGDFYVIGDEPSVQSSGLVTANLRGTLVTDGSQDFAVTYRNGVLAQVT